MVQKAGSLFLYLLYLLGDLNILNMNIHVVKKVLSNPHHKSVAHHVVIGTIEQIYSSVVKSTEHDTKMDSVLKF